MKYGCIGEKLGHSFSKEIHHCFAAYPYELPPNNLDAFMKSHDFSGINVTIPYKQAVMPYLDNISSQALDIGAVNTIVQRDGQLWGYNTDFDGMKALLQHTADEKFMDVANMELCAFMDDPEQILTYIENYRRQ